MRTKPTGALSYVNQSLVRGLGPIAEFSLLGQTSKPCSCRNLYKLQVINFEHMLHRRILGPDCSTEAPCGKWSTYSAQLPWVSFTGNKEAPTLPAANTSWDVCRTSPLPPANPSENWLSPRPHSSPHSRGLTADAPGPLCVWGGGGRAVGGGQGPHGRTHCCPQAGGLCFLPSSARARSCATPSHGPVNRIHPEVRAPGPLTATLTGCLTRRPPTALIDPRNQNQLCGGSPAPCETCARLPPDPVHGDHVTARGRVSPPPGAPKIRGWSSAPPTSGVE